MPETCDALTKLQRHEMACQWLLAAVTDDDDTLDELQEGAEQSCACCTAAVTRGLAAIAAYLAVELRGQEGAEYDAERRLADCLDEIATLETTEQDDQGP
jgi:hypothetical protein